MRNRDVGQIIAAIVSGSLSAAACGGSIGSSSGPTDSGARADGSETDAGVGDGGRDAAPRPGFTDGGCYPVAKLAALTPGVSADYLESRSEGQASRDGGKGPIKVWDKVGEPCKTASNATACLAALDAISRPYNSACAVPIGHCTTEYLVYTRKDEVGSVASAGEVAKFLAPIETLDEAVFVLDWPSATGSCLEVSYRDTANGYDVAYSTSYTDCSGGSGVNTHRHDILSHVARDGKVTVLEDVETITADTTVSCAAARRAGEVDYRAAERFGDAGDYFAHAAYLEASSVAAFARLARELSRNAAPAELVLRAARAARDERRHAGAFRALARRAGKNVWRAAKVGASSRSLETIAIENTVEGAVRETWGAVVAAYQARAATDPETRRALSSIAADEATHAELAADVAAWLASRLGAVEVARVADARRAALEAIERDLWRAMPRESVRIAVGLPSAKVARALFSAAREQLLAA